MVLFFLLLLVKGADTVTVQQFPSILFKDTGQPLVLNCEVTGSASLYIYWYKQHGFGELKLMFFSVAAGSIDPTTVDQFTAKRPNGSHLILESAALAVSDSAVYYCAGSTHSSSITLTVHTKTTAADCTG